MGYSCFTLDTCEHNESLKCDRLKFQKDRKKPESCHPFHPEVRHVCPSIHFSRTDKNIVHSPGKCDGVWLSDAPLHCFYSSSASSDRHRHQQVTSNTRSGRQYGLNQDKDASELIVNTANQKLKCSHLCSWPCFIDKKYL